MIVRYGDTIILVTAVCAKEKKDVDFLPLTVEYQEKLYSAGRIPGSYFRREGRLTEKETLTSRLVDRSCRPLFPEGYAYETQVIASVISSDSGERGRHPRHHRRLGGADALRHPLQRPHRRRPGGPRGRQLVANPTAKQRESPTSTSSWRAAARPSSWSRAARSEVSEADMVAALEFGKAAVLSRSSSCRKRCAASSA